MGKTPSLPVHHCIGNIGSVFMMHLNQRKIDETMKNKTKHYLLYFVFIVVRPDLLEVCLRLPARDCNQSVISEGCLVAAFLLILSFLTGTNEKVDFSTSQSGRQPVSYSAHPTGPATRQLISHRWRSRSAHQQVSHSESCSTDNQVSPMPLDHLSVRSVSSLANQREWLQSISHLWAQPVIVWQLAGAPMVHSCCPH